METTLDPTTFSLATLRAAVRILESKLDQLDSELPAENHEHLFATMMQRLVEKAATAPSPFGWVDEPALAVNYAASILLRNGPVLYASKQPVVLAGTDAIYQAYAQSLHEMVVPPPPQFDDAILNKLLE